MTELKDKHPVQLIEKLLDELDALVESNPIPIKDFVKTHGLGTYSADKRGRNIGKELLALDPETATASEIAEIIGNKSWICERFCNECGKQTWDIVEIGEEPDYGSATAEICLDCLKKAVNLIEESK